MAEISENVVSAIANLTRTIVSSTRADETIDAEIVSLENVDIGEYKVSYQGSMFSAFSDSSLSTYRVGERVYILVPQGDFTLKKIILGRSAYSNTLSFAEAKSQTNYFRDTSPNWLEAWYYRDKKVYDDEGKVTDTIQIVPQSQIEITASPDPEILDLTQTQFTDVAFLRESKYIDESIPGIRYPKVNTSDPKESGYLTADELEEADKQLRRYAESAEYIKIEADFTTLLARLPRAKGSYGIRVNCLGYNPDYVGEGSIDVGNESEDNEEYINNYSFELTFPDFTGAPYSYTTPNTQTAYFSITPGTIFGLHSVELFQNNLDLDGQPILEDGQLVYDDDGTKKKDDKGQTVIVYQNLNTDTPNIYAADIKICFAEQVRLTDSLYDFTISCPYGDAVSEKRESVKLVASLKYNNQEILDASNCEIHWFRRDPRQMQGNVVDKDKDIHNKTWYDYAGPGWMPIGSTVNGRAIENADAYEVDFNVLTINRKAIDWQWLYKAVVTYYGSMGQSTLEDPDLKETIELSQTQMVYNTDSKYNLAMKQTNTNSQIHLEVVNLNDMEDDSSITALIDRQPNSEWFASWYLALQDDSYNKISYDRGVCRGPYRVDRYLGNHYGHFYALAYDPYIVGSEKAEEYQDIDGTYYYLYQADPIGVVETEIASPTMEDIEWSWEGSRVFTYDAQGKIKTHDYLIDHSLTPHVHFADGKAIGFQMKIYGPDGEIIEAKSVQNATNPTQQFHDPETPSLLRSIYVQGASNSTIHFKVAERFVKEDAAPSKNTFTAVLESGGVELSRSVVEIQFTKDGDIGTIGNEWSAVVAPCNSTFGDADAYDDQQFLLRYNMPCPLVLRWVEPTGTTPGHWEQNERFRLFLRPFVSRLNTPLEKTDQYEGYFYRVYWDLRMPAAASNEAARYAAFLRLCHVDGPEANTDSIFNYNVFERDNIKDAPKWNQGNSLTYAAKVNEKDIESHTDDGLFGFTQWPLADYATYDDFEGAYQYTYGAVEIKYFDNATFGTGASLSDMQYRFIVKAQIDVCKGSFDNRDGVWRIHDDTGTTENIATINCFYPVDVIFDKDGEFDKPKYDDPKEVAKLFRSFEINWPLEIKYNSTGYLPETQEAPLSFKYTNPDSGEVREYAAWNVTPEVGSIEDSWTEEGGLVQHYKPKPHLNFTEGMHGALTTTLVNGSGITYVEGQTTDATGGVYDERLFKSGFYLRNQILYLNQYGNVDINGWDGQGIDMNEDNGTIFAVTVGAGYKSPQTNLFTGVLMGADSSQKREDLDSMFSTYADEDRKRRPYMTGLFGYQDGVQSFGLMENGTAFFGRADGGGRIIIDGANATMYGGANGQLPGPTDIVDPMWNAMRLSFVDFTHAASPNIGAITGYQNNSLSEDQIVLLLDLDIHHDPNVTVEEAKKQKYSDAEIELIQGEYVPIIITVYEEESLYDAVIRTIKEKQEAKDDAAATDDSEEVRASEDFEIAKVGLQEDSAKKKTENKTTYGGFRYQKIYTTDTSERYFLNVLLTATGEQLSPWYVPIKTTTKKYDYDENGNLHIEAATRADGSTEYIPVQIPQGDYTYQGFDGAYYTYDPDKKKAMDNMASRLPLWYSKLWSNAYIKRPGQLPYWYATDRHDGKKYEDLSWYNYELESKDDGASRVQDTSANNWRINYFNDLRLFERQSVFKQEVDSDGNVTYKYDAATGNLSGFGPSRASTTPAIEIGQHPTGLMPGILDWDDYEDVFKYLSIPGDRNFMVTYDGTLWAMNGIFMGAVIGSNIIGGRIQGAEFGVGRTDGDAWYYRMDPVNSKGTSVPSKSRCHPAELMPPRETKMSVAENGAPNVAFYVNAKGEVVANKISIYGGRIDVGRFHIMGSYKDFGDPDWDSNYGHLIQVAESDFIGETHLYGNAFVAPTIANFCSGSEYADDFNLNNSGSTHGNFAQVYGTVALGIPIIKYAGKPDEYATPDNKYSLEVWEKTYKNLFDDSANMTERRYAWTGLRDLKTLPPIDGSTIENSAMFGICSTRSVLPQAGTELKNDTDQGSFMGHFWPLHFHYGWSKEEQDVFYTEGANGAAIESETFLPVKAYVTTMDLFKGRSFSITNTTFKDQDENGETKVDARGLLEVANYFRIGPYGSEGQRHWIRATFQSELSCDKPVNDNPSADYLGWVGLVNRKGTGEKATFQQFAIGMTSWYSAPIMFTSDGEGSFDARGHMRLAAGGRGYNWSLSGETWTNPDYYGAAILMGTSIGNQQTKTRGAVEYLTDNHLHMMTGGGPIGIAAAIPYKMADISRNGSTYLGGYAIDNMYRSVHPAEYDVVNHFVYPMGIMVDPTGQHTGSVLGQHGSMSNRFLGVADALTDGAKDGGVPGLLVWGSDESEIHIFRRPPESRIASTKNCSSDGHSDGAEINITELWMGTTTFKGGSDSSDGAVDKEVAMLTAQDGVYLGLKTPVHVVPAYGDDITKTMPMLRIEDYSAMLYHTQLIELMAGGKHAGFATAGKGFGLSMYWNETNSGEEYRNIKFGWSSSATECGYFHGYQEGFKMVGKWAEAKNQHGIYARFA